MTTHKETDDKLLITLSDVLSLFRRSKKRILRWSMAVGALGALLALIQPIRYHAEATFREKSIKSGNSSNSLLQLLSSETLQTNQDNEANVLIKSRKLMQEVIQKLNLQGDLELKCEQGLPRRMRRNLSIVWATLKRNPQPVLADAACPFRLESLTYSGEIPLKLIVNVEPSGDYEVRDKRETQKIYGRGSLGSPFQTDELAFMLLADKPQAHVQELALKIDSLAHTSDELCKKLQIENAKTDKGVLKLSYEHRDRHHASHFINTVMQCYQDYLKTHHQKLARLQLDYLHSRQAQLAANLNDLMQKHANFLSNDLFNSGFVDSEKEMEFLAESQHEYREKLLNNELEIKRLENIQPDSHVYYDSYKSHEGDSAIINNLLKDIRDLKQRRDGLEIEIQKKAALDKDQLNHSFERQLQELKEVQRYKIELQDAMDRYHQHLAPDAASLLLKDPRFLIKDWFDKLDSLEKTDPIEWQKSRESFQFYLNNLERLFNVHEKILQARLTHQQSLSADYQGIDLRVAEELYVDYSKQLIQLEATIRQNAFFIHQMEDPDFEMTSLSAGLKDPISQEIIKKASQLVLTIKDQNNQSAREQERLKDELNVQRTFLALHLKQMVQLMELNKQLIDEKVYALQNVTLELIHQQLSLLETTLIDYIESRLENLRQERTLIKQHLRHIHNEMAGLPKKWVAEQLIEQEVETNQLIVEEIAKMVESKNIAHNLEVIQSAPIDVALPPVYPVTPPLFLFSLLGCFVGGIMGSGLVLGSALNKGLRASKDNLKLMGCHVSGCLSDSQATNVETLRRLQSYLADVKTSLLIEGKGPDYAGGLAEMSLKKGKKVLRIYLDFDEQAPVSQNGLLQYLEGRVAFPAIEKSEQGDVMQAGGASPYGLELLSSAAFQELMSRLQTSYDWIIGVSAALPTSVEAESLVLLFFSVVVSIQEEKVEELGFYADLIEEGKRKVSFIFNY